MSPREEEGLWDLEEDQGSSLPLLTNSTVTFGKPLPFSEPRFPRLTGRGAEGSEPLSPPRQLPLRTLPI